MALRGNRISLWRFLRLLAGLGAALAIVTAAPADARSWRHVYRHAYAARRAPTSADPAFAAIVVDANTGRTLYAVNPDAPRHPASITKVMTLYLLFEQLDKGALTLQSQIPVSEHAAAQEPSKLGIDAGDTISVDDAIKAIVTRSANDVAVAIAEAIGGNESAFAEMMTRKARALGMTRTLYRNASGLPNDEQITTARDLTTLARAVEQRFPRYFKYFSTHEFDYNGEAIGNHNHLLGRVDGVDGIKTGYTRASGFNLLTSVHRDGRSLVAAVMGGRTAAARDAAMETLIAQHVAEASDKIRPGALLAAAQPVAAPLKLAAAAPAGQPGAPPAVEIPAPPARPAASPLEEGDAASADDEEDGAPRVAAASRPGAPAPAVVSITPQRAAAPAPAVITIAPQRAAAPASPQRFGWVKGPTPAPQQVADASAAQLGWVKGPDPASSPAKSPTAAVRPKEETDAPRSDQARSDARDGGWLIQIGATDDAAKAADLIARARSIERVALASAKPSTEKVTKGDETFYRARFIGLDSASAETACRSLKKSGVACFAARE
jgi:D-alanyl-D-alanine carboxypeptidase